MTYHLIVILLFDFVMFGWSVKPVFDVANNMRLVLLPGKTHTHTSEVFFFNTFESTQTLKKIPNSFSVAGDTSLGTIVYRLRASDAEQDYPLVFKIKGKSSSRRGCTLATRIGR